MFEKFFNFKAEACKRELTEEEAKELKEFMDEKRESGEDFYHSIRVLGMVTQMLLIMKENKLKPSSPPLDFYKDLYNFCSDKVKEEEIELSKEATTH